MSSFIPFLLGFIGIILSNGDDCIFQDSGGSGQELDLTALAHTQLSYPDEYDITFDYTPCQGKLNCGTNTAMAIKHKTGEPTIDCIVMTNWDQTTMNTQPEFTESGEYWTFKFENSDACDGQYSFEVRFICDGNIADYKVLYASSCLLCCVELISMTNVYFHCEFAIYRINEQLFSGDVYRYEMGL